MLSLSPRGLCRIYILRGKQNILHFRKRTMDILRTSCFTGRDDPCRPKHRTDIFRCAGDCRIPSLSHLPSVSAYPGNRLRGLVPAFDGSCEILLRFQRGGNFHLLRRRKKPWRCTDPPSAAQRDRYGITPLLVYGSTRVVPGSKRSL